VLYSVVSAGVIYLRAAGRRVVSDRRAVLASRLTFLSNRQRRDDDDEERNIIIIMMMMSNRIRLLLLRNDMIGVDRIELQRGTTCVKRRGGGVKMAPRALKKFRERRRVAKKSTKSLSRKLTWVCT
jgi:hypothetical protein